MEKIYRILGQRGRTTLPDPLRRQLGLRPNDVLSFRRDGERIIVQRERICNHCGQGETFERSDASADLKTFLSSLTYDAQRQALIYLTSFLAGCGKEEKRHG